MLSGFAAAFLRKGSRQHGIAGNVFVISMLTLSVTGTYMAFLKSQPGNVLGGALTFYLVATSWVTARSRDGHTGLFDWGAFLLVSALGTIMITYGIEAALSPTGLKYGGPAGPYFIFGAIASLAAIGDFRMLRRGVSGKQRIARHLWRMCFALFVASASIFLARAHLFPVLLQKTGVLFGLSFLPLGLLIFWMFRVRFAKRATASILAKTERAGETSAKASPLAKDSWPPVGSSVRSKPFTNRPTDLQRVG
jgi:hypothetical protein